MYCFCCILFPVFVHYSCIFPLKIDLLILEKIGWYCSFRDMHVILRKILPHSQNILKDLYWKANLLFYKLSVVFNFSVLSLSLSLSIYLSPVWSNTILFPRIFDFLLRAVESVKRNLLTSVRILTLKNVVNIYMRKFIWETKLFSILPQVNLIKWKCWNVKYNYIVWCEYYTYNYRQ